MIKVLTAYTHELDNPEKTVRDILDQLDLSKNLLKNSAALLFCHAQFIEMGVMETVSKSLPFDTVGCTSQHFATPDTEGELMLMVMVLTSDDTEFAAGISGALDEKNLNQTVCSLYTQTTSALGTKPDMAFVFEPTMLNVTPDIITAALDRAGEGIPLFGSLALDMDTRMRMPRTIYRGEAYADRIVLLLLKGPVKPRFYSLLFPIPEQSVLTQEAVITEAIENRIISINNESAESFLQDLGLLDALKMTAAIPLVLDNQDGTSPKVVIMRGLDPQGGLICSRHIQTGEMLNIGAISADFVLEGARTMARKIKNEGNGASLFFSCLLRSVVLGGDFMAEVDIFRRELAGFSGPWLYLSSGGEVCPQRTESGEMANRVNQYALVACQF